MAEVEGVIRFALDFRPGPAPAWDTSLARLAAWRRILFRLELIGQHADRYEGYGYGNLSLRRDAGFVVTASQTSGRECVDASAFCSVNGWVLEGNRLSARGPQPPSSESLTHAACYEADADVACVMHVHSAIMWKQAQALGLARTAEDAAYGTVAMARAIALAVAGDGSAQGVVTMGGHEDGVLAFGRDVDGAGESLLQTLASAYALQGA